jgi:hypothetical protein
LESSEQGNNRKRKNAEKMAEKRKLETPQQHQKRIEKMFEYSQNQKYGNNRKNLINGISLLNEFEDEILENKRGIHVPMITKNIKIENSVKKSIWAYYENQNWTGWNYPRWFIASDPSVYLYRTKWEKYWYPIVLSIASSQCLCNLWQIYHWNWIKKNTLIQHKARLTIPDINSELQKCYQVSDPYLHELLLSPIAGFKKNGEYLCCTQCERALQNDRLDKNPPKYAIANNFAMGTLPQQLSGLLTDVTRPLLSPVKPFAYMMSYSGGAHKSITGTFTFLTGVWSKILGH